MRAPLALPTLVISVGLVLTAPTAAVATTLPPAPPPVVEPTVESPPTPVDPPVVDLPPVVDPPPVMGPPPGVDPPPTGTAVPEPVVTGQDPGPEPERPAPTPSAADPEPGSAEPQGPTGASPDTAPGADAGVESPIGEPPGGAAPRQAVEGGIGVPARGTVVPAREAVPGVGGGGDRSAPTEPRSGSPARDLGTSTSSSAPAVAEVEDPARADDMAGVLRADAGASFRNTAAGILSVVALLLVAAIAVVAQPGRRRGTH
ncbi:hypothetical protein E8P82_11340 [Arthrobacter echini]|uniref:Uncharacterized protein n=1 Tax=Arthrobacter echini TaxID=1529066 RepID=A0A4S5E3B5_9MICC|nr:hypothetical protein [Arthrobacter echini]THJ65863.1 hypothetical protein E8P82_11340 [Arthrobacter echini]